MLLYSLPVVATTVYKSVDKSGVVNFSDTLIEENTQIDEMTIDIEATTSDTQVQQRLEDMRRTTDRMATDRMAREKHRAEMRELQAQSDALDTAARYSTDPDYPYPQTVSTTSVYYNYGYPYWRHHRRHHGHLRPKHPVIRPPLRPDYRDKFPAPHIRPLFTPRTRGAPRQ
ncbi:MAG: DUF4124 domain-containing protein [Halioglobus sp.]|nr:DUF4124 domain-containing protein [Halioglobus sp.]